MSDVAVVQTFLDAFGSGDVATALRVLHENVQVSEPAGLPTGGEYDGREAFVGFLEKTGATYGVEIHDVTLRDGGDVTVAVVDTTWTSVATGARLETQFCELYTVADGKITALSVFPKDTRALYELTVAAK
jgi:ketosteroid isomerase-like protein